MKKIIFCLVGAAILFSTSVCFTQEPETVKKSPYYVYLSDLVPVGANVSYSFNKDADGAPIQLGELQYEKGICMENYSEGGDAEINFVLGKPYDEFNAVIGIGDKDFAYKGKLIFEVLANGKKTYSTKPLGPGEVDRMKLPIKGVKELTLKARSTTEEFTDFVVWANAYVF